jgi:hypothetical protein
MTDAVNHPSHYGGADNPYEAIKVIEAWSLGFCLGNAIKYISRAGKKADPALDPDAARGDRADASMAKQLRESIERNGKLQAENDQLLKQIESGR